MKTIQRALKAQIKYYGSLAQKKFRQQERKYIIEGTRLVQEALQAIYPLEIILADQSFLDREDHGALIRQIEASGVPVLQLSSGELSKISDTVTSQGIIAISNIADASEKTFWKKLPGRSIIVALDNISDPGNLGTILRTCDWFGVDGVFLSVDTVELYNPKVVRSTMGAIFHLPIFTDVELLPFVAEAKKQGHSIIVTTLEEGKNAYQLTFPQKSILVFGSEAHGVKNELIKQADVKLTIPKFGKAESLNVAAACAAMLTVMKSEVVR
jgi:TrmH family RNA methyltransferase